MTVLSQLLGGVVTDERGSWMTIELRQAVNGETIVKAVLIPVDSDHYGLGRTWFAEGEPYRVMVIAAEGTTLQ